MPSSRPRRSGDCSALSGDSTMAVEGARPSCRSRRMAKLSPLGSYVAWFSCRPMGPSLTSNSLSTPSSPLSLLLPIDLCVFILILIRSPYWSSFDIVYPFCFSAVSFCFLSLFDAFLLPFCFFCFDSLFLGDLAGLAGSSRPPSLSWALSRLSSLPSFESLSWSARPSSCSSVSTPSE